MQESKNNNRNKEMQEYQNQKRERESSSSRSVQSHDHLNNIKMSNTLDVRIQGRQKRPSECVCKEKGAPA